MVMHDEIGMKLSAPGTLGARQRLMVIVSCRRCAGSPPRTRGVPCRLVGRLILKAP
jgi:hypothetical protein